MPVRARSRSSISAITCLPDRLMWRRSSSSGSTPSRIMPPSRASAPGSSTSVCSMAARNTGMSSSDATRLATSGACRPSSTMRTRGTAPSDCLSPTRSRGPATPSAARATSRSRSCTDLSASRSFARSTPAEGDLLDRVEAVADRFECDQRADEPGAQQTAAHRRDGLVDLVEQRSETPAVAAFEDLEVFQRDRVDEQMRRLLAEADRSDVREVRLLAVPQVARPARRLRRSRRRGRQGRSLRDHAS